MKALQYSMAIVDDVGLLCLIIGGGENHKIIGRTKLQKIAYFCQYLDWDITDYRLHYYGPFSFALAETIKTAESVGLVTQSSETPYSFSLADKGGKLVEKFAKNVCDPNKVRETRKVVENLSRWSKKDLELAATIDFVKRNTPAIEKTALLDKVGTIKENFSTDEIKNAHGKWIKLKKLLPKSI